MFRLSIFSSAYPTQGCDEPAAYPRGIGVLGRVAENGTIVHNLGMSTMHLDWGVP